MSVAWNWDPFFGSLNNAIGQYGDQVRTQNALNAIAQSGQSGPMTQAMLPLARSLGPQGLPLLLQAAQSDAQRSQRISDARLTPMTADQMQQYGIRPGTGAGLDISGNPHIYQESDMKSPGAVAQAQDQARFNNTLPPNAYQRAELVGQAAERAEKVREFNLSNPMLMGSNGQGGGGPVTLDNLPQGVKNTVQSMLDGRMAPPSAMALKTPYWQQMINIANGIDPNFDQTAWGARAAARKDFMGGGKSYQTLNAGNTAIQHLGRLYDQINDVAGHQIPLVGNLVNAGENAILKSSGQPGVPAYNDTLGHLSEETTKFYRQTGGSESDVQRNMGNLADSLSTPQKQAGIANTTHLIYGKLTPMVEQYNKTMGTNYPASHFLSNEAVNTIRRMGFDPDTGEKVQAPAGKPATPAAALAAGWSLHSDAKGNKAYVSPDGKDYLEVQ